VYVKSERLTPLFESSTPLEWLQKRPDDHTFYRYYSNDNPICNAPGASVTDHCHRRWLSVNEGAVYSHSNSSETSEMTRNQETAGSQIHG